VRNKLTYVVKSAAWLEIIVGAVFILWPAIPCLLLFGATPENIGWALARWVGVSLVGLGVAFLPSRITGSQPRAVSGLLLFNIGLFVLLAWVGLKAPTHGFLLWPGVILHFLISLALAAQLLTRSSPSAE
jgi:hypothetical protein